MIYYFDELTSQLDKAGLQPEDIMIIGSASLSFIRNNNDIDFCIVNNKAYKKIILLNRIKLLFIDHYAISENVDLFSNRYIRFGYSDKRIINEGLFTIYKGYKIVIPELEYLYKIRRNWPKDIEDLKKIHTNDKLETMLNWSFINQKKNKTVLVYELYFKFRKFCSLLISKI